MDFTYVEFPCTVNKNVLKAYFDIEKTKLPKSFGKTTHSYDLNETNTNQAKSLRHLVLDAIISNWNENPIFKELPRQEDRNYILSNLNVNLPLKQLSRHIRSSFFWNKAFCHRWKVQQTVQPRQRKPWINIYMERHLQEFIENVQTSDYDQESVQETLDICAEYINQLEINFLQPSPDGQHNHIPLDFILSNLPELHTLRLTYCTKSLGMNFYLGCNTLSKRDVLHLARGLSRSHELLHFCLHSTKLSPYQLHPIARNLDRGCHNLTSLALVHCSFGNEGIRKFLQACNKESFSTLKILDLTNNKITFIQADASGTA
ncbi:uncharacterized protein LOC119675783 [Teleopsis dalmanni]|uniref:uncharacterized protein LOC119675783 n=1 Tax=Teleopsis dalmanni TaxID=139649 RepID=UPI0018CEC095|nr:uncharacterized protein LOC119675783 [Teleopsis dalmanni]